MLLTIHAGFPLLIVALFSVLFSYLYTAGPYPLAYLGLGDFFVLLFFGPVAVVSTVYVQIGTFSEEAVLLGLATGFLVHIVFAIKKVRNLDYMAQANEIQKIAGRTESYDSGI